MCLCMHQLVVKLTLAARVHTGAFDGIRCGTMPSGSMTLMHKLAMNGFVRIADGRQMALCFAGKP